MEEIVFLNGKFMPKEKAKIPLTTPGLLYGWGLFETMRSYNNRIVYFNQHLKRIKKSCKLIRMNFPSSLASIKENIKKVVKMNGLKDAYVRLTLWKSSGGIDTLIMVRKYKPYPPIKYKRGFRVCISQFKQNESSFLARLKTTNYLLYQLAYLEARRKGLDEAILLNNRGYITEASRSNIFLVKDNQLFTPALECGCLDGITRKVIFDLAKIYNVKIHEGNFILQDLYHADETFLTNSLLGVMPLVSVEKHKPCKSTSGFKLTQFLMRKYNALLKNGT